MQREINDHETTRIGGLEFRKGCPACEHTDPELEREIRVFAELLLDIYLARPEEQRRRPATPGIDNVP